MSVKRFGDAVTTGILARLEAGVSFKDAAIAEGIKPETARSWLTRGRRDTEGPYFNFALAVKNSRALAEAEASKEMTPEEFEKHLSAAIRNGSVQAMKLWHEIRQAEKGDGDGDSPGDPFEL